MSVFLRTQSLKRGIYLSFVESFYDESKKNSVQKVIKKIGYLDDLKKVYVDPIAHFKDEAKALSLESSKKYLESKEEKIPREEIRRNLGYFLVENVYNKLNFEEPFTAITINRKMQYDLEELFRFFVYSQIVNPGSKISEYDHKGLFFNNFAFSDDQMYDGVKEIAKNEDLLKEHILLMLNKIIKIDCSNTYFDGTNIYFEIDRENEELKRGPEKNNRHDPIIGLGLLMDNQGIPINYTTFPGNQSEQGELHKNVKELKRKSGIVSKTIITADKGLNSGDNMYQAMQNGDGYILGQKVRGASDDTLTWIFNDSEGDSYQKQYDVNNELVFMYKSEIGEYEVKITSPLNKQKSSINLIQKRVVFWSKDYAEKAKHEREKLIEKAKEIIANPAKFLKSTVGNAAGYIKSISYDSNGEIVTQNLTLNHELIENESKLDGYYMIVTSETKLDDHKIIEIYRGLWEIEETFSIIKGVLKIRPVFAKTLEGVHAHILVCFTALIILRLLQKKYLRSELSRDAILAIEKANKKKRVHKIKYRKYYELTIHQIVNFIRNYQVLKIGNNYYVQKYIDTLPYIEKKYGVILDKHILTIENIKKIFTAESQHMIVSELLS